MTKAIRSREEPPHVSASVRFGFDLKAKLPPLKVTLGTATALALLFANFKGLI